VLVFEQRHFLRFHNADNSGRTCIYFGKLRKSDALRPLYTEFFEKFGKQAPVKSYIVKMIENEVNEGTLRKVARNRWNVSTGALK
jgi:hypothetical protein